MKWIEHLENRNIPFNMHIIESNDSIVFHKSLDNRCAVFLLDGCIKLLKVFTNGETICEQLLYKNNSIFNTHNLSKPGSNYYYKATAVIKTAIVTVSLQEPINLSFILVPPANKTFATPGQYENRNNTSMTNILCSRNTKKRIIQLLLIFAKNFGEHTANQNINIPFCISHQTISLIIGSNRTHVSQIMSNLKKLGIISYNNQKITIYSVLKLIQV